MTVVADSRPDCFDAKLRTAKRLDADDAMRRERAYVCLEAVQALADECLDFLELGSDLGARTTFRLLASRARAAGATLKELVAARDAA
ncbi:MAG TPA: hypothetical protein VII20_21975 [Roseiarcus sp.]|jgi:hypothetical protein